MKVNEGVIDGDDVHFARIKSSPGDQAPDAAKSIHFDLHHLVSGMRLAQHGSYGYLSNGQEQRAPYVLYEGGRGKFGNVIPQGRDRSDVGAK